jgi:hypothetical protein
MTLSIRRPGAALLAILAGVASALLALALAGPASAGQLRFTPQRFTIDFQSPNPDGVVNAWGQVYGQNGVSTDNADGTVSVFDFGHRNTVTVNHDAVNPPLTVVQIVKGHGKHHPGYCIATGTAGGNWQLAGGTGKFRGAQGQGGFTFDETVTVPLLVRGHHHRDGGKQMWSDSGQGGGTMGAYSRDHKGHRTRCDLDPNDALSFTGHVDAHGVSAVPHHHR